jgi:hypothetical protein
MQCRASLTVEWPRYFLAPRADPFVGHRAVRRGGQRPGLGIITGVKVYVQNLAAVALVVLVSAVLSARLGAAYDISMKGLRLGMTREQVATQLGRPIDLDPVGCWYDYDLTHKQLRLALAFWDGRLSAFSGQEVTVSGCILRLGMPEAEVIKVLGTPDRARLHQPNNHRTFVNCYDNVATHHSLAFQHDMTKPSYPLLGIGCDPQ